MKSSTHSASLKESHTRAYTAKKEPSLPRPQCGFVPPAKFLLVRHAFIYIHFPVLCEPPLYQQREKIRQSCCHKFYPQPFLIPIFNFSHKRPTFAFAGESGYTLAFRRRIAHKGTHGETGGVSDGGWYHYPRYELHVYEHPRAGYQNGKLCRFWALAGCTSEGHRKPAEQRCAHARRCSEASRPRWAA